MQHLTGSLNNALVYKDINSAFDFSDQAISGQAYLENNCVVLTVTITPSAPGGAVTFFHILDTKYIPRIRINGVYAALNSNTDMGKFISASIDASGNGAIYMANNLSYNEEVTFVYPCRSS